MEEELMCLGIPGEVIAVHAREGLRFADVRFGGITREVCLECQPDAGVGDFVLVHVGFAIARIDRDEAARAWDVLEQLGQTDEVKPFKDDNPFRSAP
jgi:hydrogenase expression/formation protein HypC